VLVARSSLLAQATEVEEHLSPEMAMLLAGDPVALRAPKDPSQVAFEAALMRTPCNLGGGGAGSLMPDWRAAERAEAQAEAAAQAPWKAAIAFARAAKRTERAVRARAARERAAAKTRGAQTKALHLESGVEGVLRDGPAVGVERQRRPEAESRVCEIDPVYLELAFRAAGLRAAPPSPGALRAPTSPALRERCNGSDVGRCAR
jgi:hypothetical protein